MGLWQDVRFAARLLLKERWFAAAAGVALALGIAVNATVFTLVNAVLIRGLPFENPDTIMALGSRDAAGRERGVSLADFEDWRQAKSFEGLALWGNYSFNLSDAGHVPDRYSGTYISANVFGADRPAAGTRPQLPAGGRSAWRAARSAHQPQRLAHPLRGRPVGHRAHRHHQRLPADHHRRDAGGAAVSQQQRPLGAARPPAAGRQAARAQRAQLPGVRPPRPRREPRPGARRADVHHHQARCASTRRRTRASRRC